MNNSNSEAWYKIPLDVIIIQIIDTGGKCIHEGVLVSMKTHSKTQLKQGSSQTRLQTLSLTRYETQPLWSVCVGGLFYSPPAFWTCLGSFGVHFLHHLWALPHQTDSPCPNRSPSSEWQGKCQHLVLNPWGSVICRGLLKPWIPWFGCRSVCWGSV